MKDAEQAAPLTISMDVSGTISDLLREDLRRSAEHALEKLRDGPDVRLPVKWDPGDPEPEEAEGDETDEEDEEA